MTNTPSVEPDENEEGDNETLDAVAQELSSENPGEADVDPLAENLTEWDEPADSTGGLVPKVPLEDEISPVELLTSEGLEEADRDLRIAAADPDSEP